MDEYKFEIESSTNLERRLREIDSDINDFYQKEDIDEENFINQDIPIPLIIENINNYFESDSLRDLLSEFKLLIMNISKQKIDFSDVFQDSNIIERLLIIINTDVEESELKAEIRKMSFLIIYKLLEKGDQWFHSYFYNVGGVDRLLALLLKRQSDIVDFCLLCLYECILYSESAHFRVALCLSIDIIKYLLIPNQIVKENTCLLFTLILGELLKKFPKSIQVEYLEEIEEIESSMNPEEEEQYLPQTKSFFGQFYDVIREMIFNAGFPDIQSAGLFLLDSMFHIHPHLWIDLYKSDPYLCNVIYKQSSTVNCLVKEKSLSVIFHSLKNEINFPEFDIEPFIDALTYETDKVSDVNVISILILDCLYSNDAFIQESVEYNLFQSLILCLDIINSNSKLFLIKLSCTIIEHFPSEILVEYLNSGLHQKIVEGLSASFQYKDLVIREIDSNLKLFSLFGETYRENMTPYIEIFEELTDLEDDDISHKAINFMDTVFPPDEQ